MGRSASERPAALQLLAERAQAARSDPQGSEAAILEALLLAPDDTEVRLGAYRFYFYNHRYESALTHCEALLAHAARRLNVPVDWRAVCPDDAEFTEPDFAPGFYLQVLLAWGYCQARLDRLDTAQEALAQCARLDPTDRFGAAAILRHVEDRLAEAAE